MAFPVTFDDCRIESDRSKYLEKKLQQEKLLNALMITDDPKKLKELAGIRTTTEVYRTLDRLAMRKEYHEALARHGLDFDFMVKKLKQLADNAASEGVQLGALQALMKSVGIEKYEVENVPAGSWEDELMKAVTKSAMDPKALPTSSDVPSGIPVYAVEIPQAPAHVKEEREKELAEMKEIFKHAV